MAKQRLTQLRLASRAVEMVGDMVTHHLRPGQMSQAGEQPTARAIYRYFRDVGGVAVDTLFPGSGGLFGRQGAQFVDGPVVGSC